MSNRGNVNSAKPPDSRGESRNSADADAQSNRKSNEPNEPPPALAPYIPPPVDLLPSQLQEYVHAASESLNVDVAFILLPLLSSLGTAIGNSRAIWLKRGFIQYPVIWTGIVGRSGSRKSPSQHEACFPVMEHEQELMLQNKVATELYEEELVGWERKKPSDRAGCKPEKPPFLACRCDDLTIEVLADILVINPRGVLVQKDELSHFFASFDQYKNARGSDVSRWLSLHTAVSMAVDRRTQDRHYRIAYPHVGITGGIQPKILQRTLTPEYFERGLPARFIFAYPPFRQDKWREATVPDDLHRKVWELFSELWLLQPNNGVPLPLPVEREAKEVFVRFYNQCGVTALKAGEHEEAVWSKLTGYGARLGLIGQLAHTPCAEKISDGAIMEAACRFALWAGNESARIYSELAETPAQREQREFIEFIQSRRGVVTVRDVITYYWPLRNQRDEAEWRLNALVRKGLGKWEDWRPEQGSKGGRPTRVFRVLLSSASAQPGDLRGKNRSFADAGAHNRQNEKCS